MKKAVLLLFVFLFTFCLGVIADQNSISNVSLETISKNPKYYDGNKVQIVSYIQRNGFDDGFNIGEQFDKPEISTYLDIKTNSVNLDSLRTQLLEDHSVNHYKRTKVLVQGKVIDNCNKGILCCFGGSITIIADEVRQLEPTESYNLPEKFRAKKHE